MRVNLKTKIWLTILFIVLMFSFFTLYYFPRQQGILLINNYNNEIQNLANTVALGVKIAITEQNFEGVETAMEFVKDDPRLQFVSMVQYDTTWDSNHMNYAVKKTLFNTFPESEHPNPNMVSNDSIIVKNSVFQTAAMSGAILLGFNTSEIVRSKQEIRSASLIVSGMISLVGVLIGLLLARKISVPVLALRNAAIKVGEGDLDQKVLHIPKDEIGELGAAFNNMVDDLAKTREQLNEKNNELSATVSTLNNTLVELKSTQNQLIQSEKMASLGELTAGIAHEIQNPLNFVNNFSEVNKELLAEMNDEIDQGNWVEVKAIARDVIENEEKINHHGKRADAIVKGMVQHSRSSAGTKEPTDINALADEYVHLAYHGLRAKDKRFNATFRTDYDQSIGKINIIPQDIGRVILNLLNNAFYAAVLPEAGPENGGQPHVPVVWISTKKVEDNVLISVRDNGPGIPKKLLDKIFQPFFTTKPAGQGTGLGLSLSYDIVVAHGGELRVNTEEGAGCEFIIQLPVQ